MSGDVETFVGWTGAEYALTREEPHGGYVSSPAGVVGTYRTEYEGADYKPRIIVQLLPSCPAEDRYQVAGLLHWASTHRDES